MQNQKKIDGILLLDKSEGMTSQTAVNRVKRLFGADKAGHTGTLDPLATGMLPVMLGRAVKAGEYLLTGDKHYLAGLLLGMETDTADITGQILSEVAEDASIPSEEAVMEAVAAFRGEILQVPPMYSAIRVDGKRLMELARKGIEVERQARPITVYSLTAERVSNRLYMLDVVCSKGTYIRTLCEDIGKRLGCGAVMKSLRRLDAAGFSIDAAFTLEQLEAMTEEERLFRLVPVESLFADCPCLQLPPFYAKLAHAGAEIYLKKLGNVAGIPPVEGTRLRLCDGEGFFALGELRSFPDGLACKPIKLFRL